MAEIRIRDYQSSDQSRVLQQIVGSMEYHIAIHRPIRFKTYTMKFLKDFLREISTKHKLHKGKLLVAVDEQDQAIGFIFGEIEKRTKEFAKVAVKSGLITELYVSPEFRHKKVAQKLMTEMENYLSEQDCVLIRLKDVHQTNIPAKKLYEKIGYIPRVIEYAKEII